MRKVMMLFLSLSLAACSDEGTSPDVPSMAGSWEGAALGVSAEATLTETNGAISGSGSVTTPLGRTPTTITGTNDYPSVSLAIRAPGQPDGSFSGAFTDPGTVAGTLVVPGFPQIPLTLKRK